MLLVGFDCCSSNQCNHLLPSIIVIIIRIVIIVIIRVVIMIVIIRVLIVIIMILTPLPPLPQVDAAFAGPVDLNSVGFTLLLGTRVKLEKYAWRMNQQVMITQSKLGHLPSFRFFLAL